MTYTPQIRALSRAEYDFIEASDPIGLLAAVDACNAVLAGDRTRLNHTFVWSDTDEGLQYWIVRHNGTVPLTDSDKDHVHTYKLLCEARIETLKAEFLA